MESVFRGVLLGTALGDALGLPFEGLSTARVARSLRGPLAHRFLWGRGFGSDDTDHTWAVGQALLETGGDGRFGAVLARRLRWWLWTAPPGIGWATLRALVRSSFGVPADRSGVWSAGNGAAMRAVLIGVWARDRSELERLIDAATAITHTDPRARDGAFLVAWAAHRRHLGRDALLAELRAEARTPELAAAMGVVADTPFADLLAALGLPDGPTGFVVHTVPVAIACWFEAPSDVQRVVEAAVRCGGDTDTVAAIAGGLAGAVGPVPADPLARWVGWPDGVERMEALAGRLADRHRGLAAEPLSERPLRRLARNLLVGTVAVGHVLRRWTIGHP